MIEGNGPGKNSPGKVCQEAVTNGTAGLNRRLAWKGSHTTLISCYYGKKTAKFRKIFLRRAE